MDITLFKKIYSSTTRSIPLIIDEKSAISCLNEVLGKQIESLEECKTENFENVYIYEKEEDKVYMTIPVIRRWLSDLSEKPYVGKNIYILRDFDEATHQAMNATLKALEEPPLHAVIFLVVKNPEAVLETIRSRTIQFFSTERYIPLSDEITLDIECFFQGEKTRLLERIQSGKLDENTVLLVLMSILYKCQNNSTKRTESCIDDLLEVHENPRNILDRAILYLF